MKADRSNSSEGLFGTWTTKSGTTLSTDTPSRSEYARHRSVASFTFRVARASRTVLN